MDVLEKQMQEACTDAISRQALLDDFGFSEKTRKWGGDHSGYNTMMLYEIQDVIESAPSVNLQEPKTGHWIDDNDGFGTKCSECGKWYSHSYLTRQEVIYCCRCGAKMAESEAQDADIT